MYKSVCTPPQVRVHIRVHAVCEHRHRHGKMRCAASVGGVDRDEAYVWLRLFNRYVKLSALDINCDCESALCALTILLFIRVWGEPERAAALVAAHL